MCAMQESPEGTWMVFMMCTTQRKLPIRVRGQQELGGRLGDGFSGG